MPLEILAELPTEGDTTDQVIQMSSINAVIALIATLLAKRLEQTQNQDIVDGLRPGVTDMGWLTPWKAR